MSSPSFDFTEDLIIDCWNKRSSRLRRNRRICIGIIILFALPSIIFWLTFPQDLFNGNLNKSFDFLISKLKVWLSTTETDDGDYLNWIIDPILLIYLLYLLYRYINVTNVFRPSLIYPHNNGGGQRVFCFIKFRDLTIEIPIYMNFKDEYDAIAYMEKKMSVEFQFHKFTYDKEAQKKVFQSFFTYYTEPNKVERAMIVYAIW